MLVLRTDLKMSRGKIAIQVAHAAVGAAELARKHQKMWWRRWFREGQKKVAVKVATLDELMRLREEAVKADLPTCIIQDRGLTEIPPGTVTVLGIGPVPTALVDKITRDLPLL